MSDCWQKHEVDARLANGGADLVGVGHLAPLVADRLHVDAVLLADRDPALAERAVADDRDPVAGSHRFATADSIAPDAGGREEQHVGLGAVDALQPLERARVDLAEVGAAVVDDRLRPGRQDLRRDGSRAGREEVSLLQVRQVNDSPAEAEAARLTCRPAGRATVRTVSKLSPWTCSSPLPRL